MIAQLVLPGIEMGILIGVVYALVAAGFALVFGVMRIVNFAHGQFLMVAMYGSLLLYSHLGVDPYLAIVIVAPLSLAMGMIVYKILMAPIMKARHEMQLIVTLALAIIIENIVVFALGGTPRAFHFSYADVLIPIGATRVDLPRALAFVASFVVLAGLFAIIRFTHFGRAIRAIPQEMIGAQIVGINVARVNLIAFGIGIASAALAGLLMMPMTLVSPFIGFDHTLRAFLVTILAGAGSIVGLLVGGILVGVIEMTTMAFLPGYVSSAIVFVVVISFFMFKPFGLFGKPV